MQTPQHPPIQLKHHASQAPRRRLHLTLFSKATSLPHYVDMQNQPPLLTQEPNTTILRPNRAHQMARSSNPRDSRGT